MTDTVLTEPFSCHYLSIISVLVSFLPIDLAQTIFCAYLTLLRAQVHTGDDEKDSYLNICYYGTWYCSC